MTEKNPETTDYWSAAEVGKLLLKSCRSCGEVHFYPRSICPHCFSPDTEWVASDGRGEIYAFTVMRRADPPSVIAYVTLAEGVTMLTNIIDCDEDGLSIGDAVTVDFAVREDRTVPVFKPVDKGVAQ
ncbi:Zn-ribbon domain-containing OB-fold protein [Hoeflea sp.]|uniref:Zn-ribbon domain-containing OB-fold protein n=1 Tax=Hoeflea sp. TaxID=1940281 RepID=UPI003A8E8038